VPSSTSNSKHPEPNRFWLRTWCVALILALAALGALEAFWRSLDYDPVVADDKDYWASHRDHIYENGDKTLVLIGASRVLLGFDMELVRARFPDWQVVQLAISGSPPGAVLRDLANDENFKGVVLCSVVASGMTRTAVERQQSYVSHYHDNWKPKQDTFSNDQANRWISSWFQARLALINPDVNLRMMLVNTIRSRALPASNYLTLLPDRSRQADYQKIDIDQHRAARERRNKSAYEAATILQPRPWLAEAVDVFESQIKKIEERGGKIILLRYPASGRIFELDEEYYPRHLYWDAFSAQTTATAIHFQDIASLSGFELPDGYHFDYRDVPDFTNALLDELDRRQVFVGANGMER